MTTRTHLLQLAAILALAWLGDKGVAYFQQRLVDTSLFRYSRLYDKPRLVRADVLLVGNSRGLMFYEPAIQRLTGLSTLNLSYNALSSDISEALIGDYIDRCGAPRYAVIEITHADRNNPTLVTAFAAYAHKSARLTQLLKDTDRNYYTSTRLMRTVAFNNEVFHRALAYRNQSDNDWLLDRVITDDLSAEALTMKADTMQIIAARMANLQKSVALLRNRGAEVFLVVNPYYPAYGNRIPNIDNYIAHVTQSTGLQVYDYRQLMTDKKYFGDLQHVNIAGAEVLMHKMLSDFGLLKR